MRRGAKLQRRSSRENYAPVQPYLGRKKKELERSYGGFDARRRNPRQVWSDPINRASGRNADSRNPSKNSVEEGKREKVGKDRRANEKSYAKSESSAKGRIAEAIQAEPPYSKSPNWSCRGGEKKQLAKKGRSRDPERSSKIALSGLEQWRDITRSGKTHSALIGSSFSLKEEV